MKNIGGQGSPTCFGVALLMCVLFSGCHRAVIRSHEMPEHVRAKPPVNMAAMDFASMGVTNSRSDHIYPGDVVQCTVAPGVDQPLEVWESRVSDAGTIDVPYVGPLQVANQPISSSETLIRQVSVERGVYRNPAISVAVKDRRTNRVEVVGAVHKPGIYELPTQGSNLVAAVSMAGGAKPTAGEVVEIYDSSNASNQPARVNIPMASATGQGNLYLNDGAVIHVAPRQKQYVHVLGNASTNRSVELSAEHATRLLDALAEVGGLRYSNWICDTIHVTRQIPGSVDETVMIKLSVKKAREDASENILLAAGDVIHVDENPITFTLNTIQGLMGVGVSAARFAVP